ncbi:CHAP domain-containing protein [Gluconobacter oxydans]|uniref:CHAP domain-containing protein n=1 Tax=Gluconobacter oxydans TaxID=442 RepID=UPI001CD90277|nr:CHAP domain-containing protein [Gluconobacter oxydans]
MMMPRFFRCLPLALLVVLTACGNRYEYSRASFNGPLQCAPYARERTGLKLSGSAASWWGQSVGRYAHTHTPRPGEVLVFRATSRVPSGHVSIVRRQVSDRTILVDHANWEPGRIDRAVPVTDVSARNDWTLVRVWWAPVHSLGKRAYPTYGFISSHDSDDSS